METKDTLAKEAVELVRQLLHALIVSSPQAWLDLQLTLPQLRIVFIIAHGKSPSVTQIAQQLGIGEPTASHLVDKLVKAHWVERAEDPEDRRRTRVRLTPAGEELIDKLLGWEDLMSGLLDRLDERDITLLQQGLRALVDELHVEPSHHA